MKIILNCESVRHPLTGIGNYTFHLLRGLAECKDCELYTFSHLKIIPGASLLQEHEAERKPPHKGVPRMRCWGRSLPCAYPLRARVVDLAFRYQTRAYSHEAVYHEPNFILKPFDGISITTIHDLSWIHYPQFHPRERITYMERSFPPTRQRASHFITDSEYVKSEMTSILGIPPHQITAVPLGVSAEFSPRSHRELEPCLNHYGLKIKKYILSVGTLEPRKNLAGLLDAYMSLPSKQRKRFPLVMVGGKGWCSTSLEQRIRTLEQKGEVRHLDYVPGCDLPMLYAGATAFVFPSIYEGFGLPPLEAMASGVPVITSSATAMEEVVGDAGLLVPAQDTERLYAALENLLSDSDLRRSLSAKGVERAAAFTWERCIAATLEVYRTQRSAL
ncbi:MAG: glycosyltransferase family 4 protein [Desulfuromonadaceae bacterium]